MVRERKLERERECEEKVWEAHAIEMQSKKEAWERAATEAMIVHERQLQHLTLQNDLDQKKTCPWNGEVEWRR